MNSTLRVFNMIEIFIYFMMPKVPIIISGQKFIYTSIDM